MPSRAPFFSCLVVATLTLPSCGLGPTEAPGFDDAVSCAGMNMILFEYAEEPGSADALNDKRLAQSWLAYAGQLPGHSPETANAKYEIEKNLLDDDIENLGSEMKLAFRCAGFEVDHEDALNEALSKTSKP